VPARLPPFHLSSEETTFWIIVGCSDGVSNGSRIVKRIKKKRKYFNTGNERKGGKNEGTKGKT